MRTVIAVLMTLCLFASPVYAINTDNETHIPTPGGASLGFGVAAAVSGDTAVVGAYRTDAGNNIDQGAAYIYQQNQGGANNWGLVKEITAPDGNDEDNFGISVAISGDTVVIGAFGADIYGNSNQGAAYVFGRNQGDDDNWGLIAKLSAEDGDASDDFGTSVAINEDADIIVVGAPENKSGRYSQQGAVYVFYKDEDGPNKWGQKRKLYDSAGKEDDGLGFSVSVSGEFIATGAWLANNGDNLDQGAAYIFQRSKGGPDNWGMLKKIMASDGQAGDTFGAAVSVSGDILAVGAFQAGADDTGAAYVFHRNQGATNNWGQMKKLAPSDGAALDYFGVSTAVTGDAVAVGADGKDGGKGAVYIYGGSSWGLIEKLTPSAIQENDNFGASADAKSGTLIIGAPGNGGSAYVYTSAGVSVTPTSGLETTESGGTATFSIVLTLPPTSDVVIGLSSSDAGEGTVSPASVTFTTGNWASPKTVTVTGVNDDITDGDQTFTVVTAPATSADADFNGYNPADVTVTNIDNDIPGVTVNPTSGLTTTESGGTAQFTVVLNTQPSAGVSIDVSSDNPSEGTVSTSNLSFSTSDWNTPKPVTVTGVDDNVTDGNQAYTIILAAAVSSDPDYSGVDPTDVSAVNTDDDTPGITITPSSGVFTTEAGGTTVLSVVLNTQPTADVTVTVSSSNTNEGTVSPDVLNFAASVWSTPQSVTVSGVDDGSTDGDRTYYIRTQSTSADAEYNNLSGGQATIINIDDETPAGVTVSPSSGLTTTEQGGESTFTVRLNSTPMSDVTLNLTSNDPGEGTVSPASLQFDFTNWNAPQSVTLQGVDDNIDDGNIVYTISISAVSGDARYNGLAISDVSATNTDDDTAGISISPTSGLVTTESGNSDRFSVVLDSEPTDSVTIGLNSNNTSEGAVSPTTLTFTSSNWYFEQVVTVTGVDDGIQDGDVSYSIETSPAVSMDPAYHGLNIADVSVINRGDGAGSGGGITVSPTSGLTTTESGGMATFSIVLDSAPTSTVTIGISSSDSTEGTASPSSVVFSAGNWNIPQTVTVTGADDTLVDGDISYQINTQAASSADSAYNGMNAADVSVTNTDDDGASGITVAPIAGLVTSETGAAATFTVVLDSAPASSVTINLSSSDTGEGTVSPFSLTFTISDWSTPKTVTVTGVDDSSEDGDQTYTVITSAASSADPTFSGKDPADVQVINQDDDTTVSIIVEPTSGLVTTEDGGTAAFGVSLGSRPSANVVIGVSSGDATEGTVSPASLTFTAANWSTVQQVTVTGVDDAEQDGGQDYAVILSPAVSNDVNYSGLDPSDVSVRNSDNDMAVEISVEPTVGLATTENGGTASFWVVLGSEPAADVTIGLYSTNMGEGTVSPSTLTFTTGDWFVAQQATVTGRDDGVSDGNKNYTIVTTPAVSDDTNYNGVDPPDVLLTNVEGAVSGDGDNDGMPDSWENEHGLDPDDPGDASEDPDGDGATNLEEYQNGTDPNNPDSDGDGMPDGWEISNGLNPNDPGDANGDADGDGYSNYAEYLYGSDPNDPNSTPGPRPPSTSAGEDQTVTEGETVTLGGSNVTDPLGFFTEYLWTQTGGDVEIVLSDPADPNATFVTPPVSENGMVITFELTSFVEGYGQHADEVSFTITDNGISLYPDDVLPFLTVTGDYLGVKVLECGDLTALESISPEASGVITGAENEPRNIMYGLIRMEVKAESEDCQPVVAYYFPTSVPNEYVWHVYSPTLGWFDFSGSAVFNESRDQITLTLTDGGPEDYDGVKNGVVILMSSLGIPADDDDDSRGGGGGGGGGCFIDSSASRPFDRAWTGVRSCFKDMISAGKQALNKLK